METEGGQGFNDGLLFLNFGSVQNQWETKVRADYGVSKGRRLVYRGSGMKLEKRCLMSLKMGKKSRAVCSWWEKGIRKSMFLVGEWELKEEWTTVCSGWKNWGKWRSWKREILSMWHGRKGVTEREVMESRCLHVEDIGEIPMWRAKEMQEQGKREDDSG